MRERQKIVRGIHGRWLPAAAATLLVSAATGLGAQGQAVGQDEPIESVRPLLELARLMEQRYASPVTYEDPLWGFEGDIETIGGKRGLFPLSLTFTVPRGLTPEHRPKLDAAVLGEALAAYHSQTDGPRFKIATSRLGLHLIPDQVRGTDGRLAPARNALETVLNMPVTLEGPSQHLADLCAALSAATGARIVFMGPSGNFPLEQIYMPNGHIGRFGSREDLTVAWGAKGISAREALISLLEPSATTLDWHFICRADLSCFIQVGPISLSAAMANGQTGWTDLLYDRCTVNCPKLVQSPPTLDKK